MWLVEFNSTLKGGDNHDRHLKYKAIAEIMGLTPYALQMKIDNETEFKASEIDTLANTLGMDMQQRDSIFFCKKSGI